LGAEEQIKVLSADLDALVASLNQVLERYPDLEDWISECRAWVEEAKNSIRNFPMPQEDRVSNDLIIRYKSLRWPTDSSDFERVLKTLRNDSVTVNLPVHAMDMYFPLHRVVDLPQLLRDAVQHRGSQPNLSLWDSGMHDRGFANDGDSKYILKDIVLKTRVALFSYALTGTCASPSRILTANILRRLSDPFTKDFGRFFVFSKGLTAEATFDAGQPARDWDSNSVSDTILFPPQTITLPSEGDNKVALAFVWRVFEEEPTQAMEETTT
jgi:hypothetical protein